MKHTGLDRQHLVAMSTLRRALETIIGETDRSHVERLTLVAAIISEALGQRGWKRRWSAAARWSSTIRVHIRRAISIWWWSESYRYRILNQN